RMLSLGCVLVLCLAAAAAEDKVRFNFSQTGKILLSWDEVWEVGSPNMMAFLMPDKSLKIKIALEGRADIGHSAVLKYKCANSATFNTIDLSSVTRHQERCESTQIPFSVRIIDAKEGSYEFKLLDTPLGSYDVFNSKLELLVEVLVAGQPEVKLVSNSLFVWSLEPLGKYRSKTSSGSSISTRFLTPDAVSFLKNLKMESNFGFKEFLDPSVVNALRNAPPFLRAKINMGAVLNFDAGSCENYQVSRAALFVNYHSKLDDKAQNLLKHIHLNLATGRLHYAAYGLSASIFNSFEGRSPTQVGICATLSFSGQGQPYDRTFSVEQKIPRDKVMYTKQGVNAPDCSLPDNVNEEPISIFSGMDHTPLVCPIICSDPLTVYKFTHTSKDHRRKALTPMSTKDWTEVDGIRVSKTGNIIEFPPTAQNRHAGQYMCEAGNKKFTFNADVVSMPQFSYKPSDGPSEVSGSLPAVIYAMEGESMSYNCSTYFNNVAQVTAEPVFYSPAVRESADWKELRMSEFNSLFGSRTVSVDTLTSLTDRRTINITVSRVPPGDSSTGRDFTHRVICRATVGKADAEKIGMPKYVVESGSSVFFLHRPTPASFDLSRARNCSEQRCSTASGAEFSVALKPEVTAKLKAIGVEVMAMFKIDDVYLKDLNIINQKGVSEITFERDTNRLTFKVHPITDDKVLVELQKRKTLTPVFNFRYPSRVSLVNLQLHKDRHGSRDVAAGDKDCRADRMCFYSTDFDVASSLRPIVMGIDFQGKPVLEVASAGPGILVAILIAFLLLLLIAALLVFLLRRDSGQTYMLDEKERQQGNHPDLEAKEEQFKEYQRPEEGGLKASRLSLSSSISAASKDDQELDEYGNDDDIDVGRFAEDGSFIGGYTTDPKKREAFNAHRV
ncbi:hypothetical protein BOX15_Mlig021638g1, partial [Macrostomum lignano]